MQKFPIWMLKQAGFWLEEQAEAQNGDVLSWEGAADRAERPYCEKRVRRSPSPPTALVSLAGTAAPPR